MIAMLYAGCHILYICCSRRHLAHVWVAWKSVTLQFMPSRINRIDFA